MLLTALLTEFSALGLPRVDYKQFAKSLEKKLLLNGKFFLQFSLDIGLIFPTLIQIYLMRWDAVQQL